MNDPQKRAEGVRDLLVNRHGPEVTGAVLDYFSASAELMSRLESVVNAHGLPLNEVLRETTKTFALMLPGVSDKLAEVRAIYEDVEPTSEGM